MQREQRAWLDGQKKKQEELLATRDKASLQHKPLAMRGTIKKDAAGSAGSSARPTPKQSSSVLNVECGVTLQPYALTSKLLMQKQTNLAEVPELCCWKFDIRSSGWSIDSDAGRSSRKQHTSG